jgi:hypothetical protein
MSLTQSDLDRFWAKVEKTEGCWNWTAVKRGGYGLFRFRDTKISAHRLTYELIKGAIPDGLVIDHLCRNRACVNPDHLEAVTNKTNILRGAGLCAANAVKDACPKGHPYTPANTYTRVGSRACRECHRIRTRLWMRAKRGYSGVTTSV